MKKNIYIMYAIALFQRMVFYGPIATLYRTAAGISVFEITVIESISIALMIALEIPFGRIADKIGYRTTMILCSALYFLSKIVFLCADSFFMFLLERLILSAVCAGLSGVDSAVLFLSCGKKDSQKVFGIYNGLSQAGLLFAAIIYSSFIGENFRFSAFLTVLSYAVCFILSLFLSEVKENAVSTERREGFGAILRQTFANKKLLLFILSAALISEAHQTITVFLNQLKYASAGMSERMIAAAFVIVSLCGLCGALSDRFTKYIGKKFFGICIFSAAIISCLILSITQTAIISVMCVAALRICFALVTPLSSSFQNENIKSADRATALSIHSMLINSVGVFTNLTFGKIANESLCASFIFGAILCTAALSLFIVATSKKSR